MTHAELVEAVAKDFKLDPKVARDIVGRVTAYAWGHEGLRGTPYEVRLPVVLPGNDSTRPEALGDPL